MIGCSFLSDVHMVVDATIKVYFHRDTTPENIEAEEQLYPKRHQITLPLNSLNMLFQHCETSFNHSTKLDTDR